MVSTNKQMKVGFYLDTENLGGNIPEKQSTILEALQGWPRNLPPPTLIALYVTEDTDVWKSAWETVVRDFQDSLPGMATVNLPEPVYKPAHQYSRNPDKNAADITLVLDALDDVHQMHTDFAVILSNDSDFAGLLFKLREVQQRAADGRFSSHSYGNSPFLLITHANSGRSQQLDILETNVLRLTATTQQHSMTTSPITSRTPEQSNNVNVSEGYSSSRGGSYDQTAEAWNSGPTPEQMAGEVALKMNKTMFNGIEAYIIIKERWPNHPEMKYDAELQPHRYEISRWFSEKIWEPVMQEYGVEVDVNATPRRYTMPYEVKRRLLYLSDSDSMRG